MALKAGRRGPRLEAGWLRGDYGLTAADPARPSAFRPYVVRRSPVRGRASPHTASGFLPQTPRPNP